MPDNKRKIYDKLAGMGMQGSFEEFDDYLNNNPQSVYNKLSSMGMEGSYEDFVSYAGITPQAPQRVDVSDVEKANNPNVVTLSEEEIATTGGKYTPREGASGMKTPEELEADAQYQAWLSSVPESRRNDPNYDLRGAWEHLPKNELEDWRTATDEEHAEGKKHLRSVYYDADSDEYRFLKSKDHESLNKELDWYNSNEKDAVEFRDQGYTIDKSGNYYKYVRDFSPEKVAEMKERNINATKDAQSFIESVIPEIERSIRDRAMFDVEADNRNKEASKEAIEYHGEKEAEKRIKAFHDLLDEHGIGKMGVTEEIIDGDLSLKDDKLKEMIVDAIRKKENTKSYLDAYYKTPEGRADIASQTQGQIDVVHQMQEKTGGFWSSLGGMIGDLAISSVMAEGGIGAEDAKAMTDIQDNIRKETSVNMKTRQMLEDAENTLKLAQKNALDGADTFTVNLARGVRYANLETLIPMTDLYGNMGLLQVFDKVEKGEELNDNEKLLLSAMYMNQNVQNEFGGDLTMGNRIGRGLPETAMFTLTFLGASEFAGAQAIGQGTEKATRIFANKLINKEIKNGVVRFTLDKALPKAARLAGETLFRTGLQTPEIMSGAIERHVGDVNINPGTGEVGFVDGVSWREAVLKSAASVANENLTEAAGEVILQPGWGWLTRNTKAGKAVNKFRETVGSIGDNKVDDIFRTAQDIKRKAGFDGWQFETLEEMLGNFNDAAFIHDQTWEQAFSGETILETTLNCLIFGMVMGHASTGASAIYNSPNLVRTRNEKRKAKSVINGMENISSDDIDEHVQYDTAKNLADWLFAKNQEGKWNETQRGAVVNYVKASIAQSAQRNFKDIRLEEDMKASDKIADEMINNSNGNIIEATFNVNGQNIRGTIVGGNVSYTELNDGSIGFNQYLSNPTLTVRLDNGEHKMMFARDLATINSVSSPEDYKAARRNELAIKYANDMHREMDDLGVNDIWGVDLSQEGTIIIIGGVPNTLKEITEDGKYVFTSPTADGKSITETTYEAKDLMMVGLIERHNELIKNGASQEQLDESIDNLNTQQTVNAAEESRNEDNIWNAISNFMKDYFKTDESGEFIPDESRADAAAAYLVAMRKGDVNAAIGLVDERIAKLGMIIGGQPTDNAKNNTGTAGMAEEAAANDMAVENAKKSIEFLTIIREGLVAKQSENNTDVSLNAAVSQMSEGTMFPVMWNGQRAIAVVDQHNENGDAVINIIDEEGNEIERGIDNVSDELWNQYRAKALEPETPSAPVEETKEEPVVETKEEPKEKTIEQRLGDFSAKHGANTQNKLENTVKSIKKDIDALTKQLADAEEKLSNMPEPYDTKTQKAQEKQEKTIKKLQEELQVKQEALAPYSEMLAEFDRQAAEKQGVLNKADEALQSLDENMKLYSEALQEDAVDKEPTNKHEFASTFLGSFQKSKNRLNKESLKTETGWGDTDVKKLNGILSSEGGMSVDEMAEAIFADAQEQYPGFFTDFNDAKTTLLEVLQEADNAGSIDTYIKDRRRGSSEVQARLDYEARQLGYEDAADMREKRVADARQKLESLKDKNGFITEEGLKEFQDYVEGLKIKETPKTEIAETKSLNEQVEEAGLVNPNESEVDRISDELGRKEMEWEDKIKDYVFEHYPTQANVSAETNSEQGIKEREAMKQDAILQEMERQRKAELDEIDNRLTEAWKREQEGEKVPFKVSNEKLTNINKAIAKAKRVKDQDKVKELMAEKAALIQNYIDGISTEKAVVVTEDNYETLLKQNKVPADVIMQVGGALDDCHKEGVAFNGFQYEDAVYLFAEADKTYDDARVTYVHERQHIFTRRTKKGLSLQAEVRKHATVDELEHYVELLSGTDFYTKIYHGRSNAHTRYADEFISMAMERAYNDVDIEQELRDLGIKEDLINIIKTLNDEQKADTNLAKSRKFASINELNSRGYGRNGKDSSRESREVGGQRPGSDARGSQTAGGKGNEVNSANEAEESSISYSVVSSPRKLAALEAGEKIKVYRAMQMVDGKLYPPMAAKVNGKWQNPIELGVWEQADEHPELADEKGYFKLDKGNGKSLKARYNPYIHTSRSPLNDQFTSAYDRPNLVTVEVEVPASELTSGYKAEKAKNAVGETSWHSGPVAGKLSKIGKPRVVVLSRYDKPIRIVPDSEVAQHIAETLKDTGISIPYNVVTPSLRAELEKAGVKVAGKAKGNVKEKSSNNSVDNENLFVNLLNEKGEINNERLNEILKRAEEGDIRTSRLPAEKVGRKVETPSIAAEAIGRGVEQANLPQVRGLDGQVRYTVRRIRERDIARKLIKQWAKDHGYWYDETRLLEGTKRGKDGTESQIYVSKKKDFIRKLTQPIQFYEQTQPLLESIELFGTIFPETAYTVKGFGENYNHLLCAVVEQPMIDGITLFDYKGDNMQAQEMIDKYLEGLGFKVNGFRSYTDGEYIVSDLHPKTVVIDANGDLFVVDARVELADKSEYDGNVMFSVSAQQDADYLKAVESGDMTKAQEMVDDAAERAGYTIRGYHGTTHLFNIFDKSKGNAEGNWGKGFYFTNNEDDANSNYATSEGPDLNSRIELMAEQMEWWDGYEDMDYEQRKEEARKILDGGEQRIISAALRMENPLVIGTHADMQETYFDYNEEYDEENDEYGEPSGLLLDFAEAWDDVMNDSEWEAYSTVSASEIIEYGFDGGLTASQLEDKAREILDTHGIQNEAGEIATGDFLRKVFERMGFDGIVDSRVNFKFGTQSGRFKSMDGMDYGTIHFIVNEPNQIKQIDPVTYDDNGNVIPLSQRFNSENNDIRYSISETSNDADEYNRMTGANVEGVSKHIQRKENILRSFFDGLRPLEQMQKLMSKKMGRKLRDSEDAYNLATLLPSLNKAEMDAADLEYYNPTARQFADLVRLVMRQEGLTYEKALEKVNNYLLAKHGLERNEWFKKNDPESEEKDRAGLKGLAKSVGEKEDNYKAVAEKIVKGFESGYDANKFWTAMKALSNRILEIGYEKGLINKAILEELKKRFEFYVPLRGFAETTSDDMFDYVRTSSHFQNVFQKAKGRTSKADDPMSNIRGMLQSNIVLGNHNKVMQRIYNMAVNAKSDLLRITKPWFVYNEAKEQWEEQYPDITEDMTYDQIDEAVRDFNNRMQKLAKEGKAQRKVNNLDLGVKVLKYQAKEHEMIAYVNGERVLMHVAGNPLVAQQLNSSVAKEQGILADSMQGITRFFSMINTSLSPAFMFTNAARDIGFSLFSAFVSGGGKKNVKMLWNIMKSMWVLPRLIATGKMNSGIIKMLNKEEAAKLEQWWHEFISNGGETGFVQTLNAEKMKGEVNDTIKRMVNHPKNKDGEAKWRKALNVIETMGRYSEDISRFAAYCLKRAEGESVQKSITEAKNVTVNFNVKGGGNSNLARVVAGCRACYSFFNAALQGINRMARLAKENPKRFAVGLTTCVLQGFMLPWLNMMMFSLLGGDDDDWRRYEMLTEYTANHSLVLYVGNHKFIRISYSQELAPFAAMGNIFFRQQMGWNHGSSVAAQIADMFVDLAPVNIVESKTFGGKMLKTVTPTFAKPLTELILNEDFTGSPIYKDNQHNKYDRGWEKAYEGKTSKWLIDASKYVDDNTGIDINPAMVEHIAQGLFGGLGRSGDRLLRFVSNGFQLSDAPFVRTLMFSSNPISYKGAVSKEYGRLAYDVLPKVQAEIERMSNEEFIKFMNTEEYKIADAVSIAKTGKSLLGTKVSESSIDKDERAYKKARAVEGLTDEQKEILDTWSSEITEEKMELIDEITQIIYENSGDTRKWLIETVGDIKKESKTKNQE